MGNSITDGLKSRLTQYLKHVVEDDVLFTNSNPLHNQKKKMMTDVFIQLRNFIFYYSYDCTKISILSTIEISFYL